MVDIASDLAIPSTAPRRTVLEIAKAAHVSAWGRLEKRWIYRRTLAELQTRSRRSLLDIGIDPDDLPALARRAAGL